MGKIKATRITLDRAEGPVALCVKRELTGQHVFAQADRVLAQWWKTAPHLGYHKVDFTIHYEDGEVYQGRYDLGEDHLALGRHIHDFCLVMSGMESRPWIPVIVQLRYLMDPENQKYGYFIDNYEVE